jgi:hypothetical protein
VTIRGRGLGDSRLELIAQVLPVALLDSERGSEDARLVASCGVREVGSCGVSVFVDEASEAVASFHAG